MSETRQINQEYIHLPQVCVGKFNVMAKQVRPTHSYTGVGQGSNEAEVLISMNEGRYHQGQVSADTD